MIKLPFRKGAQAPPSIRAIDPNKANDIATFAERLYNDKFFEKEISKYSNRYKLLNTSKLVVEREEVRMSIEELRDPKLAHFHVSDDNGKAYIWFISSNVHDHVDNAR